MANPRFNTQTTNRRGAMGGGMMKRGMYKKGTPENGEKAKNGNGMKKKYKGFSKLPERVQKKIDPKLAKKV